MSQNYIRACAISIAAIGKTCDATGLRVRFSIKQRTAGQPNIATVKITNQSPSLAKALTQASAEYTPIVISAGYVDNQGVLFQGNLVRAIYGRENPTDTLTTILAADGGQAHDYATVSQTLAAGSTPQQHVNVAIQALSKYGVSLGFVGPKVDLSTPVYPRAVSLFGMARKVLDDVARSKGATWSIQNSKVHIVTPDDALPGNAIMLNSATGLIGMPTLETGGVYARSLINPQLKVNSLVKIDQASIQGLLPQLGPNGQPTPGTTPNDIGNPTMPNLAANGVYKVFEISVDGDTRGQNWYQDLACLVPGQTSSASIYYPDYKP
jgi:hypothetical protein